MPQNIHVSARLRVPDPSHCLGRCRSSPDLTGERLNNSWFIVAGTASGCSPGVGCPGIEIKLCVLCQEMLNDPLKRWCAAVNPEINTVTHHTSSRAFRSGSELCPRCGSEPVRAVVLVAFSANTVKVGSCPTMQRGRLLTMTSLQQRNRMFS